MKQAESTTRVVEANEIDRGAGNHSDGPSHAGKGETSTLPPVESVPAAHLDGRVLKNGWRIHGRLARTTRPTGGVFSVTYRAVNDSGEEAFVKALNVAAALDPEGGSILDQLKVFTDTFVFERELLAHCQSRRLSRIIRLLDHGDVDVPEAGVLRSVPYLVFELAEGDVNEHRSRLSFFDVAWVLRALKHTTLGIEQLHSVQTAHQDLRPSNVLTQAGGREMKLGDLGRAERRGLEGPVTKEPIPGAVRYAPLEQLYGSFDHSWEMRRAGDMYHIGSLAVQLFVGHSLTSILQHFLPGAIQWGTWKGDFTTALPYFRAAHGQAMNIFEQAVREQIQVEEIVEALVQAVREMTDPDPARRGHPRDRADATSSYAVRRYVSLFDRLASQAEYMMLKGRRQTDADPG